MSDKKMSNLKPIISIRELCEMLQLSRSRYYQLVDSGFFPKPKIDERSQRPFFDVALQKQILDSRSTGIGANGSFLLFYSPRKKETLSHSRRKQADPVLKELGEILESMGVETAFTEVQKALDKLYPDGTDGVDQGVVVRELYRYFKQM